jgi:hypothetical protein
VCQVLGPTQTSSAGSTDSIGIEQIVRVGKRAVSAYLAEPLLQVVEHGRGPASLLCL